MNSCLEAAWRIICSEVLLIRSLDSLKAKTISMQTSINKFVLFVPGGSYFQPLSWNLRLKVALGAAMGVAFLHSAETKVIYRDFKTSNILLDSVCNS